MSNTFKNDLTRGINVELILLEKLKKKYPSSTLINAYKGYDIWIPEISKSIEVKYDEKSNETGNIVIEIEMFNKPSALMTTKADYWVIYDGKIFCMILPMQIIKCIFDLKLTYREFIGSGDNNKKKAFLIPKDKLFSYGDEFK